MADGGCYWDIPTDRIPFHLRAIGSRFLLIMRSSDHSRRALKKHFELQLRT
jgi:hypothetical protein